MTERITREQVLRALEITEDDLVEYERLTGYEAARRAADAEYERFRADIIRRAALLTRRLKD